MKLSELIAEYGDDRVQFQPLDGCVANLRMVKEGTEVTFGTATRFDMTGKLDKLGLVVWMDRARVKEITSNRRTEP